MTGGGEVPQANYRMHAVVEKLVVAFFFRGQPSVASLNRALVDQNVVAGALAKLENILGEQLDVASAVLLLPTQEGACCKCGGGKVG